MKIRNSGSANQIAAFYLIEFLVCDVFNVTHDYGAYCSAERNGTPGSAKYLFCGTHRNGPKTT